MTESSKRFAWINIWMMAFSFAAICLVYPRGRQPDWYSAMQAIVPLAVVFLIGFFRMPVSFYYGGKTHRPNLNDMAGLYLDAIRQVFRQKWILWLFGSILGIQLVGWFVESRITEPYLASRYADTMSGGGIPVPQMPFGEWMVTRFGHFLSDSVPAALGRFFPGMGLDLFTIALSIVALMLSISAIWLLVRLRSRSGDVRSPQISDSLRRLLLPLALVSAAMALCTPILLVRSLQGYDYGAVTYAFRIGGGMLVLVPFVAALIGGFSASMARVMSGQAVTVESFVQDAMDYLMPVAGVLLILALAGAAFFVPELIYLSHLGPTAPKVLQTTNRMFNLLVMFAPFAVVIRQTGAWQGIKDGIRDWVAHAGDVISFVALGITFISISLTLQDVAADLIPMRYSLANMPIGGVVSMLVTAVMAVAVWEFYWRITRSSAGPTPNT